MFLSIVDLVLAKGRVERVITILYTSLYDSRWEIHLNSLSKVVRSLTFYVIKVNFV